MPSAWYLDDDTTSDPRLEHHRSPPEFLTLEELRKRTGIELYQLNLETYESDGVLEKIKKERGYQYEDEIECSRANPADYQEKLRIYNQEHVHDHEEIRFFIEGSGYFDVRDLDDNWIRIAFAAGDMIVVPGGLYHRFTPDLNDHIKARRFFLDNPEWIAYYRPQADHMDSRKEFVKKIHQGYFATQSF